MTDLSSVDKQTEIELQAAAFRALRAHLQNRNDVQNIDMMNLAGFCRNCLSRWVQEEAEQRGITVSKSDARSYVYGMPYEQWRDQYQTEATEAQKAAFSHAHTPNDTDTTE